MADEPKSPEQPPVDAPPSDSVHPRVEPDAIPSVIMVRAVESPPEQRRMVVVRRGTPQSRHPQPVGGIELPQWIGPAINHVTTFLRNLDKSSEAMTPAEKSELEIKEKAKEDAKTKRESNQLAFYFGSFSLVILLIVIGMLLNKDSIVSDIIKTGLGAVAGGLGGYGLGISKSKKDDDNG